jgi:hypothetical protein
LSAAGFGVVVCAEAQELSIGKEKAAMVAKINECTPGRVMEFPSIELLYGVTRFQRGPL